MKLEALEKAATTANEQKLRLKFKAQQLGLAARAAKEKSRLAKTKLKAAKRDAKYARNAAKDAKRAFVEVLSACEKAAAEVGDLDKKIQKHQQAQAKSGKPKQARRHKPATAKSRSARPKSVAAKSPAKPAARAKLHRAPKGKPLQRITATSEPAIRVPRDTDATPESVTAATLA